MAKIIYSYLDSLYPKVKKENEETMVDPLCREDNPIRVPFENIKEAKEMIKDGIMNTPCIRSHLSDITGIDLYLKKDFLQYTGSFKDRGARYALMKLPANKRNGVVASSAGNHAQALSYHGRQLGIPVTVVMPITAPIMKIQKCRGLQANVIVQGNDLQESKQIAMKLAQEKELTYINGFDHPDVLAGQGSVALEIMEQVSDIDAVVIPTGGGGLLAGCAVALKELKPNIKVIGVEAERVNTFARAMEAGKPVLTELSATLADGLSVPLVGFNAFETCKDLVDKMVEVKEEDLAIAILRLIELEKCVCEGSGAAGVAAAISGQLDEFIGKRVVCILTGGNIDTTILGRCLERGLAADGRLLKIDVTVSDRPGGIAELSALIFSIGVNIKDMIHERAWVTCDVYSVTVRVVCETRDYEHALELRKLLSNRYSKVDFIDFPPESARNYKVSTMKMTQSN